MKTGEITAEDLLSEMQNRAKEATKYALEMEVGNISGKEINLYKAEAHSLHSAYYFALLALSDMTESEAAND